MRLSWLLLLCLFAINAPAQQPEILNLEQQIDALLKPKLSGESPGGTALVIKDGAVLYEKAFGVADLEHEARMKSDYVFRIGSITKQFTACAILRLAEEGKLSLQDTVTRFIADYPLHGQRLTIEHLLTHTSGIKNITGLPAWTTEIQRKDWAPVDILNFFKNEPLDFIPGTAYQYSNSNYIVLGVIVELASGMKYAEYLRQNFFEPLKMSCTTYDLYANITTGRSAGYKKAEGHYANADFISMTLPFAAGGLLSNTHDLYTWYDAVMHDKIMSKASREKAMSPFRLSNGELTPYGYGWVLGNIQGLPSISHGGRINGFITQTLYVAGAKVFVAVLSNCECTTDLDNVSAKIAALAMGKPYEWNAISVSPGSLVKYEGTYESGGGGKRIISLEDGRLLWYTPKGMKTELIPFDREQFHPDNTLAVVDFKRDKKGRLGFTLLSTESPTSWTRTSQDVVKKKAIKISSAELDQYVGNYQMGPGYFVIIKEGDKLYGKAPGENQVKQEIVPFDKNMFFAKNIDAQVRFNSDQDGRVTSLTIIQNGEHTVNKVDSTEGLGNH